MLFKKIEKILLFTSMVSILCFLIFILFIKYSYSTTNRSFNLINEAEDSYYKINNFLNESTDHIIWFLQISDLHLSEFHDKTRISDFELFCNETIKLIWPKVVLVTGDITDGKTKNQIGSDQFENEWKYYYSIIKNSQLLENTIWLDVRGNHDNFNIPSLKSSNNFFSKYGIMKDYDRSYKYELNTQFGDKYTFIGVDACVDPGPKRPFNFYGTLYENDMKKLEIYANEARLSNGTIWFGHFPTSTIVARKRLNEIIDTGVAYLCGHLHTLGDLVPNFYTRHTNGLLELELADWKVKRMFRLMAFDSGIFSFRDYVKNKPIYTLITNPKNLQFKSPREPMFKQAKFSTHIRILIFSKHKITNVNVFIDDKHIGSAYYSNSSNTPLYLLKWDPTNYQTNIHKIKVIVEDDQMNNEIEEHEFSLDDTIMKSFPLLPTWLLFISNIYITQTGFYLNMASILLVLIFFRFYRRRFTINYMTCGIIRSFIMTYLRRFVLLSSINFTFSSLLSMTLYIAIGPWFVGEIIDHFYGVCFIWGIYVKNTLLSADVQYLTGFFHLLFFQIPLMFHLASIIETRFTTFHQLKDKNTRTTNSESQINNIFIKLLYKLLKYLWYNASFIFLLILCIFQIYDLYICYSLIAAIICPFKTWFLILSFYLRYKCYNLNETDFEAFINKRENNIDRMPSNMHQSILESRKLVTKNS